MHTIPHTLIRDGKYLYNRRVPVKAHNRYGKLPQLHSITFSVIGSGSSRYSDGQIDSGYVAMC